jgi:hypothetical protein
MKGAGRDTAVHKQDSDTRLLQNAKIPGPQVRLDNDHLSWLDKSDNGPYRKPEIQGHSEETIHLVPQFFSGDCQALTGCGREYERFVGVSFPETLHERNCRKDLSHAKGMDPEGAFPELAGRHVQCKPFDQCGAFLESGNEKQRSGGYRPEEMIYEEKNRIDHAVLVSCIVLHTPLSPPSPDPSRRGRGRPVIPRVPPPR